MGVGLQCFDASGNLTFNSGDYLGRFLGSFAITSKADGTFTANGASSLGTMFFMFSPNGDGEGFATGPVVTHSGDVISWSYGTWPSAFRNTGTVHYGVK